LIYLNNLKEVGSIMEETFVKKVLILQSCQGKT